MLSDAILCNEAIWIMMYTFNILSNTYITDIHKASVYILGMVAYKGLVMCSNSMPKRPPHSSYKVTPHLTTTTTESRACMKYLH